REASGAGAQSDRFVYSGWARGERTTSSTAGLGAHSDSPAVFRSDRPASPPGGSGRLREGRVAGRLFAAGGTAARLRALRRAVGAPLAGRCPVPPQRPAWIRSAAPPSP